MQPINEEWIPFFIIFGTVTGVFFGFLSGLKLSNVFVTRVWVEVDSEFAMHVFNKFKSIKGIRMTEFPDYLMLEENDKMKVIPSRTILEFRRTKWWGQPDRMDARQYLEYLVKQVEDMDIVVLSSGIA